MPDYHCRVAFSSERWHPHAGELLAHLVMRATWRGFAVEYHIPLCCIYPHGRLHSLIQTELYLQINDPAVYDRLMYSARRKLRLRLRTRYHACVRPRQRGLVARRAVDPRRLRL